MGNILKLITGFGTGPSTGWLIAGAVVAVLTVLGGTWKAGYNYRDAQCDAETLRTENEELKAQAAETARQLDSVNVIQQADSNRAARLEKELKDAKDSTPVIQCDAPAAPSSVRLPTVRPAAKGVRAPNGKHTTGPFGRGTVRSGPDIAPGDVDSGGSQPSVEPRPGFAR